jgi:hypothetical protein
MPPSRRVQQESLLRCIEKLEEEWSGVPELVQGLLKENEELKKAAAAKRARSRSPRRPSLSSQAYLQASCRALTQVGLWQRDSVLSEQREEILQLRSEIQKKDAEIARLRRGEGPLGEVLLYSRLRSRGSFEDEGDALEKTIRQRLLSRTQPVHEAFSSISDVAFQLGMFAERGYPVGRG